MRSRLAGALGAFGFKAFGLAFHPLPALVLVRTLVARRAFLAFLRRRTVSGRRSGSVASGRRRRLRTGCAARTIVRPPFGMTARTPDLDGLGFFGGLFRLCRIFRRRRLS